MREPRIPDTERNQDFFAKNLEQKTEEEKEKEEKLKGIISYILDDGEIKEAILEKKVTIIGKGEDVDIKIEGFFVGKNALLINKESGAFYVSRGDGKNSPKLNGEKIKGHIRLRDNDFIEVSSHKLRFSIKNS
jgi:pSer/pThr/pTyr-binding forkhead associated (FHA) protein